MTFFLLFAGAILLPLVATPAAAFGERAYDANTVISGTSHFNVDSGDSAAQSFLASASYRLMNLTLRIRNAGASAPINITIRTDEGGPSATILASSQLVIGSTVVANVAIPFAVPASVTAGVRYWIVATSSTSFLSPYEWHHSNADTYADGQAMTTFLGNWGNPASPTDMYFVTYGRETAANLTHSVRSLRDQADPGDSVTFRLFLNNTGDTAGNVAWLNDTQIPGWTYLADTAASAGSTTPWPSFTFLNVGNGPRSFDFTARVNIGIEPGTILTKAFAFAYADAKGDVTSRPLAQASVLIGTQGKVLYLDPKAVGSAQRLDPAKPTGGSGSQFNMSLPRDNSPHDFDLDPVLARPFRAMAANATLFLDSSSHDVRSLKLNLTLTDWDGVTSTPIAYVERSVTTNPFQDYEPFAFPFGPFDHTFPSGGRLRLTVRLLAASAKDAILAMNSSFAYSFLALETTTYIRIDRIDMRDAIGATTLWSPKDSLVVQANVSDPFGSSEIADARINLTAPSGTVIVNYTAMALFATDPSSPSVWKVFRFTLFPQLLEGTYDATVTAAESNGVLDIAESTALVQAPAFTFTKTTTDSNVAGGDRFTYDLWFNNTGTGVAGRVWINDSLPSGLTFLSSSDPGAMTGNYNWTWASRSVGNYRLSIDVQVQAAAPPVPYFRNYAFLNYTDEKGFSWPMKVAQADVAFSGPVIALTKSSLTAVIHSNETIVYSITMQNTGDPAQTLWANDTLPAGLTYVSDTIAQDIPGGTASRVGNHLYFRATNMPTLTTWSFTVTVVAAPNLVRGAILTNIVSLDYTNSNGFSLPPRLATWPVRVSAPFVSTASASLAPSRANPADIIAAAVSFTNSGSEAARDAWVNLTFDLDLHYVNATLVPVFNGGNDVRFRLTNAPIGTTTILLNASVDATVPDHGLMTLSGAVTYTDAFGNLLPSVSIPSVGVEASVPVLQLDISPHENSVEAGSLVFYNIFLVNAGSGVAGDIWLSLSLPASFSYVTDTADRTPSVVGFTYTWNWSGVAPGSKSFSLELKAKSTVLNGTRANLTFHADYTDGNGNFQTGENTWSNANFTAAQIDLAMSPGTLSARSGQTITLRLDIRNIGGSSAHNVWITYANNPYFEMITSISTVTPSTSEAGLNWSFTDLQPTQSVIVTVFLRIRDGTPTDLELVPRFVANYTNSADLVIGQRQVYARVTVVADPAPLIWTGIAASGLGALVVLALVRRLGTQIEEVFLVYRDGLLLYHLSRSLSQDKDEDVLSGMLTAVTEFVRDAFVYGEHRELHQLDFGDYRIMIERGRNLYLAVVYSGKGVSAIRKRVRTVLNHIEAAYGTVLEKWEGDMDQVVGARDLIREHLLRGNGRSLRGLPGFP